MLANINVNNVDKFLANQRGNQPVKIHIDRNTFVAIILSLILHGLILWKIVPTIKQASPLPKADTIQVTLAPSPKSQSPKEKPSPPPPSKKQSASKPKKVMAKPVPQQTQPLPKDFTLPKEIIQTPATSNPDLSLPPTKQTPEIAALPPPTDMQSYIKQQQAKRNKQEQEAAKINAEFAAKERGLTQEQKRNQQIAQNLKFGTNGIFTINRIDALGATFTFKGWKDDYSAAHTQYIDVPAQAGVDTRLLVIKRIIALIREHYDGNFTWVSDRLGRSLELSARPEDNAGLEDFLMQEFFGNTYH